VKTAADERRTVNGRPNTRAAANDRRRANAAASATANDRRAANGRPSIRAAANDRRDASADTQATT